MKIRRESVRSGRNGQLLASDRILKAIKILWALPLTFLGLIAVALTALTGGSVRCVCGAIEAGGGFAEWMLTQILRRKVACMTIGHVILGLDLENLDLARAHEHVHVAQYEKWGALFVPLYIGSSLVVWMQGKHRYRDNFFEIEAYTKAPCVGAGEIFAAQQVKTSTSSKTLRKKSASTSIALS